MRITRGLLPFAVLAGVVLLACRGTGPSAPTRRSAADEIGVPADGDVGLRVFATAETRGFLGPCGCEEKQHGGFPRRATYLGGVAPGDTLRIDLPLTGATPD